MKKILLIAVSLMIAAALTSCATFKEETGGRPPDEARLKEINPGKTQKEDILSIFGEPTEVKKEAGAEKLYYIYRKVSVPIYAGGLIEDSSRAAKKETILEITIKDNTVTDYRFEKSEDERD